MAKIRIIQTPPGDAPLWVRKAWLGLKLPLIGQANTNIPQFSARGGPATPENIGGYEVHGGEALLALHQAGRTDAAEWWTKNSSPHGGHLIFSKQACVLIQDTYEKECLPFIMGPRTAQPLMRFVLQVSFVRQRNATGVVFPPGILNSLPRDLALAIEEDGKIKLLSSLYEAFIPEGMWCLISDGTDQHKLFMPESIVAGKRAVFQYESFARIPRNRSPGFIDPDVQRVIDGDNGFMS